MTLYKFTAQTGGKRVRPARALLLFGLGSLLLGQSYPFQLGEELVYNISFRYLKAGESTTTVTYDLTTSQDTVIHIVSRTQSIGLLEYLYPVRDSIDVWLDHVTLTLRQQRKAIHEGSYQKRFLGYIDPGKRLAISGQDSLELPGPVYDPLGSIYYLRTSSLAMGEEFHLTIYDNHRLRYIAVKVTRQERIKVPAGEFVCFVLDPTPRDEKPPIRAGSVLRVWISATADRLPVRIEQKTRIGTMVMRLREVRSLNSPRSQSSH